MISPIFEMPLLLIEQQYKVLVASDLHLGLEYELWLNGMSIPSQTERLLSKLKIFLKKIKPDIMVLLGDIKHNVPRTSWQEKREVPNFLEALSQDARIEIVPGNHDVGLEYMAPPNVKVHPSSGIVLDEIGYFHGHAWPDKRLFQSKALVAGHIHPAVRLKDPIGCTLTRPVWVRANLLPDVIEQQYGRKSSNLEIILVPAFNDLCGGLSLNDSSREERGPILALTNLELARVYLLDGTDLGRLREIKCCTKT
ncbi:MAG: metallophosphoesterase [Methanotrichaceae archaeon]|nr:metallophosphoesterase [Methanotrichaceae archaeon]